MYCTHCANTLAPDANFCATCGAATPRQTPFRTTPIVRPRHPRAVAGVCSGLSLHYGWDLNLVRVLTVVITFLTSGLGALAYVALWVLLPEAPFLLPANASMPPPNPQTSAQTDPQTSSPA